MKKIYREFQKIYYNLDKILLLFFTLFAFMEFVWIPLNSWVSERLLALTGHAYLSPTNLLSVFSENLFVSGLFILFFFRQYWDCLSGVSSSIYWGLAIVR